MNRFPLPRMKLDLAFQLGLTFGTITFLLALVFGWITGKLAQQQLEQKVGTELTYLSQNLSYTLDRNMFERYREIQILSQLHPFRDPQASTEEQQVLLNKLQDTYLDYSWIGFANTDGIVQISTRKVLEGQNIAHRPWFLGARKGSYIGDVHKALLLAKLLPNPTGEPIRFVDIAAPVMDSRGRMQGVLGAHLNWKWAAAIEAVLKDTPFAQGKELFVLSKDGIVLLGPPGWLDKRLDLSSVHAAQSGQSDYLVERWSDGETYLTSFVKSKGHLTYPGLGWIILAREKTAIAFAPVHELYWHILRCGLLLSSGFTVLGWFIAKWITAPLLRITAVADQIRHGDRSVKIPITSSQTETAKLSQTLNQLVSELIDREHELEEQLAHRQQMTDSLHRSEEQLRQIVDNIEDALLLREVTTGKVIYYNTGYTKLHQSTSVQLKDDLQSWIDCLHPDDRDRVLKKLQFQPNEESCFNHEYRIVTSNGLVRWIWDRSFPIRDKTGSIYRYAVIKRDITDRKHSEEILKTLLESTASVTGQCFFSTMVQHLATALDVDYVFIAEQQTDETLKTIAFWAQGSLQPNLVYSSKLAPCRLILDYEFYYCSSEVYQRFPDDSFLSTIQAQGAFGIALKNAHGQVLGVICIISKRPLEDQNHYAAILRIFATRAIAELERQYAEITLRESEERFRLLAENTRDLICLHELSGRLLYLSPSCKTLLGFEPNELVGRRHLMLLHPDDRSIVQMEVCQIIEEGKESAITYRIRKKTGEYVWLESLVKPIKTIGNQYIYLQTSSRDITDKIQIQEQLQYDATHDGLTRLPNRSLLLERLKLALERTKQNSDFSFALLFIDLDRFKLINDSLGHLAGDQLLLVIATMLKNTIRSVDLVTRLGGDEFVLLLEEITSPQEALRVADRILASLRTPIRLETHKVVLSASIGILIDTAAYQSGLDLLRDADIAMYSAKAQGKACYAIFNPTMHAQALRQMELENDLRQAIEHKEFTLLYQPIVLLPSGQLSGFEVLVRWQHPLKGIISPSEFIPIAEETGLIVPLGKWILQEACRQMASWHEQFPSAIALKVSINLSVKQLREADLISQIRQILDDTGLSGTSLTLEITESVLMQDMEAMNQLLEQLRMYDIQISIDDFGTGFSSLSYLHRLPVNNLKIDRSFISSLLDNQRNLNVTKTIITLADELGINAIAEGIESQEQLQQLEIFGCELGQGFLFSKPIAAEAAQNLIPSKLAGLC